MLPALLATALAATAQVSGPTPGPIDPETPVHLGLVLRLTHQAQLDALRAAQQDPGSPEFRRWLTPAEFGARFGQPEALVSRAQAWLAAASFEVAVYPNQSFVEARGSAAQLKALLGVELLGVPGKPAAVHVPDRPPRLPDWIADQVRFVSGLDTRVRFHHRLLYAPGEPAFGPQDFRVQYDAAALQAAGFYGQGQELVVLSEAEAPGNAISTAGVDYFLDNVSDARAPVQQRVLPNPEGDFDGQPGGRGEYQLDLEMQSVGSPGAASLTLEVPPASQVFILGPQDIANNLPTATAVSISLGVCEPAELSRSQNDDERGAMEAAVVQGTMEGQTWFAAAGDTGADDCQFDHPPATVDFPASLPEMVAVGGTEILFAGFDGNNAITGYNSEWVWNSDELFGGGGAGGGGVSLLYAEPSYQSGFGFSGRGLPDIALMAGIPGTISIPGEPGAFGLLAGTSIGAPLAAGFFGLLASSLGCRLGDVHAALYALGAAQQDGGAAVFNDITVGDNSADGVTGYSAGPGFDLASGWGSLDVGALAKAFPACPAGDGGADAGAPYSPCGFIGCTTGCLTLPEGPSTCSFEGCNAGADAGQCPIGQICDSAGPYAAYADGGGACVSGCLSNADCADGGVCQLCAGTCGPPGNPSAQVGDPCTLPTDCAGGDVCLTASGVYDGGYCSAVCDPGSCGCPAGSSCGAFLFGSYFCLGDCPEDGGSCGRPGYVCQPQDPYPPSCQPACSLTDGGPDAGVFDSCAWYAAAGSACDVDSGICVVPPAPPDAGEEEDAGSVDGGEPGSGGDGGLVDAGGPDGGRDAGSGLGADAGREDAGPRDAGVEDAGADGGRLDGGARDGGDEDAGHVAGAVDGGGPDAGRANAGGQDAGLPGAADAGTDVGTAGTDAGTASKAGGCGCSPGSAPPDLGILFGLLGAVLARRRTGRRRA